MASRLACELGFVGSHVCCQTKLNLTGKEAYRRETWVCLLTEDAITIVVVQKRSVHSPAKRPDVNGIDGNHWAGLANFASVD